MTISTRKKLDVLFDEHRCWPAFITLKTSGLTAFMWFVNDDDNCFVEVRDSTSGTDFLVVWRDGSEAGAAVVKDAGCVVELVLAKTAAIAAAHKSEDQ
jgi:hypothetical protein